MLKQSMPDEGLAANADLEPELWDGEIWALSSDHTDPMDDGLGTGAMSDGETQPEHWDGETWAPSSGYTDLMGDGLETDAVSDGEAELEQWDGEIWPTGSAGQDDLEQVLVDQAPTVPADIRELIRLWNSTIGQLPLGRIGVRSPTAVRYLTTGEQREADTVYNGSLDYAKVLISNGLGAGGRPFTLYAPMRTGSFTVLSMGSSAFRRPLSRPATLIHELAHSWQSQHNGSSPGQYMTNSILSQGRALADLPIAKAEASANAVRVAISSGVRNPLRLAQIGERAAAAEDTSAYAYVPGRPFGGYAAEQIAEQVEDHYRGQGRPTPAVISHIRSLSPSAFSPLNRRSLSTARWERKTKTGVVFP